MDYIILLALAAMVFAGLADFFLKKGINQGIALNVLLFYSFLISAVPFGVLCVIQSVSLKIQSPLLDYSFLIGLLVFIATFSLISALKIGDASIVVPIGRMGFVITAICAFLFLGETLTLTKGLGIFFAVAALILLAKE